MSTLHRALGSASEPCSILREMPLQKFDIADDDREQIVEVVSDTACQLPDGLHLMSLPEGLLRFEALSDFGHDAIFKLCCEFSTLVRHLVSFPAGEKQLLFVLPPVRRVEGRNPVDIRPPVR